MTSHEDNINFHWIEIWFLIEEAGKISSFKRFLKGSSASATLKIVGKNHLKIGDFGLIFQTQKDFYNKRSENETIFEGRYLNVFLKSEQTLEITHVLLKKRETLTQIDSTLPLNDK